MKLARFGEINGHIFLKQTSESCQVDYDPGKPITNDRFVADMAHSNSVFMQGWHEHHRKSFI